MLAHYLLIAARNLGRHRVNTLVSVIGLALGLACFVGARLFASFVDGADRHFPSSDRIFAVYQTSTWEGLGLDVPFGPGVTPLIAERLRIEYPEISAIARTRGEPRAVVWVDGERRIEHVHYVEPAFLDIFALAFTHGSPAALDAYARGALVTERTAMSLFGTTDVLGRSIRIDPVGPVEIAGVIAPIRDPSHLAGTFDDSERVGLFLVTRIEEDLLPSPPFAGAPPDLQRTFEWLGLFAAVETYLLLPEDGSVTAETLNAAFPEIVARHAALENASIAFEVRHVSERFAEDLDDWLGEFTDMTLPGLLQALGALVLATACLNFANLATARASVRGKEVGLRKTLGARRRDLIVQHLSEGLLIAAAAAAIALVGIEAAIRALEGAAGWNLPSIVEAGIGFWLFVVALTLAVAAAGALYPAVVLARVPPIAALRAGSISIGSSTLRTALIGLQFAAASFLLIVVSAVAAQNAELARSGPRPDGDPIVVVTTSVRNAGIDPEVFRAQLEASPLVTAVTGADMPPWESAAGGTGFSRTQSDLDSFVFTQTQAVSFDYFSTLGTKVLAGRSFSRELGDADTSSEARIVIDRLAAQQFGWPNPDDAVGATLYQSDLVTHRGNPRTIVGVVEHEPPRVFGWGSRAFVYSPDPGITYPIIRMSSRDVPAALAYIDATWEALAPDVPIEREFLDERFERAFALFRLVVSAFGMLASLAFGIALMGLLGMAWFVVARRQREMGVRKVLGASSPRILRLFLWQLVRPVLIANVAVWPLGYLAARLYFDMFMRPAALTPGPFLTSLGVTLLVTCAVVMRHALSSARTKPAAALRYE